MLRDVSKRKHPKGRFASMQQCSSCRKPARCPPPSARPRGGERQCQLQHVPHTTYELRPRAKCETPSPLALPATPRDARIATLRLLPHQRGCPPFSTPSPVPRRAAGCSPSVPACVRRETATRHESRPESNQLAFSRPIPDFRQIPPSPSNGMSRVGVRISRSSRCRASAR